MEASGERNSITPGAMHVTWTRCPGLKPACSSQRPMRRSLGLMSPFQRSPSASIFSVRMVGCGSIRVDDCRTPAIAVCKNVRFSLKVGERTSVSSPFGIPAVVSNRVTFLLLAYLLKQCQRKRRLLGRSPHFKMAATHNSARHITQLMCCST